MDGFLSIACAIGIVLALGLAFGLADRKSFAPGYLLLAGLLVFANDLALTRGYGLIPDFAGGGWNWTGKLLALALTLAVAARPQFGWKAIGLTLEQKREGRPVTWAVAALLAALFTIPALLSAPDAHTTEDLAFQLTLPGLEEEPFYRGLLLLALARAFAGRWRFAGIDWHWGALLSCLAFGLAHALGWSEGAPQFDAIAFALTGGPALLLVWLRERTGSLLLPVVLHNYANAISYVV